MDRRETSLGDEERRAEMLERSIAERRQRINRTLDELGERLQPRRLLDDVLGRMTENRAITPDRLKDGAVSGVRGVGTAVKTISEQISTGAKAVSHQVQRNPWPAAAIGISAVWWALNELRGDGWRPASGKRRPWSAHLSSSPGSTVTDEEHGLAGGSTPLMRGPTKEYGAGIKERARDYHGIVKEKAARAAERAKESAARISQKTKEVAGMAGEKITGAKHSVSTAGSDISEQGRHAVSDASRKLGQRGQQILDKARTRARSGKRAMEQSFRSSPFLLGAAALAGGFIVGLLLPRTRKEDELLGRRADRFGERLKEAGQQLVEQGQGAVRGASETLQQEMRERGEQLKEKGRELREKSHEIGEDVAKSAKESADRAASPSTD